MTAHATLKLLISAVFRTLMAISVGIALVLFGILSVSIPTGLLILTLSGLWGSKPAFQWWILRTYPDDMPRKRKAKEISMDYEKSDANGILANLVVFLFWGLFSIPLTGISLDNGGTQAVLTLIATIITGAWLGIYPLRFMVCYSRQRSILLQEGIPLEVGLEERIFRNAYWRDWIH